MRGRTHDQFSVGLSMPVAALVMMATRSVPLTLGVVLGFLATLFINPDLDQISVSRSEWKLVKKLGPVGFLFMAYWWLYAKTHKHRGISHVPVVGTIGRILYGFGPLFVILTIRGLDWGTVPAGTWSVVGGITLGMVLSDTVHTILDII